MCLPLKKPIIYSLQIDNPAPTPILQELIDGTTLFGYALPRTQPVYIYVIGRNAHLAIVLSFGVGAETPTIFSSSSETYAYSSDAK